MHNVSVIIPAAGLGKRMKGFGKRKPFIYLGKKPIIQHTLDIFKKISPVKEIILVVNKKDLNLARKHLQRGMVSVIEGGAQRKDSVYNGIKAIRKDSDIVLIHDGVRPLVTKAIVMDSIKAAARFGAAVVAVPVIPTIKSVDKKGFVKKTIDRSMLWEIQTPQVFKRGIIVNAYKKSKMHATDDAMLVEKMGGKVKIVLGSYENIKITTLKDLKIAGVLCA
jgi:2-C-methyl-D-erythritol 4-phosphate cytidylyltransferase